MISRLFTLQSILLKTGGYYHWTQKNYIFMEHCTVAFYILLCSTCILGQLDMPNVNARTPSSCYIWPICWIRIRYALILCVIEWVNTFDLELLLKFEDVFGWKSLAIVIKENGSKFVCDRQIALRRCWQYNSDVYHAIFSCFLINSNTMDFQTLQHWLAPWQC